MQSQTFIYFFLTTINKEMQVKCMHTKDEKMFKKKKLQQINEGFFWGGGELYL